MIEDERLTTFAPVHGSLLPAAGHAGKAVLVLHRPGRARQVYNQRRARPDLRTTRVQHLAQLDQRRRASGSSRCRPGAADFGDLLVGQFAVLPQEKDLLLVLAQFGDRQPKTVEGFLVLQRPAGLVVASPASSIRPPAAAGTCGSRRFAARPWRCSGRRGRSRPAGSARRPECVRTRQHFKNASWAASWASSALPRR